MFIVQVLVCKVARKPGRILLIDNSNLWIEGKKLAGRQQGLEGENPQWRINIGGAARLMESFEPQGPRALVAVFGSEPPPVDSIWANYEKQEIFVKTVRRSKLTGKEKRVDTSIADFLAYQTAAIEFGGIDSPHDFRSFVLVSGDGDYKESIERILKLGVRVTLWSWTHAMSSLYRQMLQEYPNLLQLRYFDRPPENFSKVGFLEPSTREKLIDLLKPSALRLTNNFLCPTAEQETPRRRCYSATGLFLSCWGQ